MTGKSIEGRVIAVTELEAARLMAPKMDESSLHIFVASGLCATLSVAPEYPTTDNKQRHHDVTGFFQRNGRRK